MQRSCVCCLCPQRCACLAAGTGGHLLPYAPSGDVWDWVKRLCLRCLSSAAIQLSSLSKGKFGCNRRRHESSRIFASKIRDDSCLRVLYSKLKPHSVETIEIV